MTAYTGGRDSSMALEGLLSQLYYVYMQHESGEYGVENNFEVAESFAPACNASVFRAVSL